MDEHPNLSRRILTPFLLQILYSRSSCHILSVKKVTIRVGLCFAGFWCVFGYVRTLFVPRDKIGVVCIRAFLAGSESSNEYLNGGCVLRLGRANEVDQERL